MGGGGGDRSQLTIKPVSFSSSSCSSATVLSRDRSRASVSLPNLTLKFMVLKSGARTESYGVSRFIPMPCASFEPRTFSQVRQLSQHVLHIAWSTMRHACILDRTLTLHPCPCTDCSQLKLKFTNSITSVRGLWFSAAP